MVGRLKDLIIHSGRNHYPQDLESTVAATDSVLSPHSGAAFSIENHAGEELVIVQEVVQARRATQDLIKRIVRAVAEEHQLPIRHVQLIKRGSLCKTSSGKVQRALCRERFLSRSFPVIAEWSASGENGNGFHSHPRSAAHIQALTETEQTLSGIFSEVLGSHIDDIDASFLEHGGDSLKAAMMAGQIQDRFGVSLSPSVLFAAATIRELAQIVELRRSEAATAGPDVAPGFSEMAENGNSLSAAQRRMWGQAMRFPHSPLHNLSGAVILTEDIDEARLQSSLNQLLARHESLRTIYRFRNGDVAAEVIDELNFPMKVDDLTRQIDGEQWRMLAREEARRTFDLTQSPLRCCPAVSIATITNSSAAFRTSHQPGWQLAGPAGPGVGQTVFAVRKWDEM